MYNLYVSSQLDQALKSLGVASAIFEVRNEYGGEDIDGGGFIVGTEFMDRINGGDGDDHILGEGGADILTGGAGNDQLVDGYSFDNDYLDGGDGDDILWMYGGHDILIGGAGDDFFLPHTNTYFQSTFYAEIFGGEGIDLVYLDGTNSWGWQYEWLPDGRLLMTDGTGRRLALEGVETLYFTDMQVDLRDPNALDDISFRENSDGYGSFGDDDFSGSGRLVGLSGDDVIRGSDERDSIYGGDGNDHLYGGDDNDLLNGGEGRNRLFDEGGDDTFIDTGGENIASGGVGNDQFITLADDIGFDRYIGGSGWDVVTYEGVSIFDVTLSVDDRGMITVTHENGSVDFLHSIEKINISDFTNLRIENLPNIINNHDLEFVAGTDGFDLVQLNGAEVSVHTFGGTDIVHAHAGSSHVHLGSGNDYLYAGYSDGLNDLFSSGSGVDFVVYDVNLFLGQSDHDFALSLTSRGNLRIHDPDGGIDTLFNVEYFAFEDHDGHIEYFDVLAHIDYLSRDQVNSSSVVDLSSISLTPFDDLEVSLEEQPVEQAVEYRPAYMEDEFDVVSGVTSLDDFDFHDVDVWI